MKRNQIPNKTSLIRIVKRKCHKNIQPHIVEGDTYVAVGHDCKGDKLTLLVANPDNTKKVWRVNSNRFSWEIVTMDDAKRLYNNKRTETLNVVKHQIFAEDELNIIYSRPTVLLHLIQKYADLVIREAAYERLSMFKAVSRSIKSLIEANDKHLYSILGSEKYKDFVQDMDDAYNENIKDFTILYYSMNNIIKKHYANYPYDTIRTNALIALMLIDMHKVYIHKIGEILKEKFPDTYHGGELISDEVKQLRFLLCSYVAPDGKIEFKDEAVELNKKIVSKIIDRIDVTPYTDRLVV